MVGFEKGIENVRTDAADSRNCDFHRVMIMNFDVVAHDSIDAAVEYPSGRRRTGVRGQNSTG